jgi:uncharacterized membrane protein
VPLFPWQKKKEFFTKEEKAQLVEAIQQAEQRTSGEVRVFVESRCRYVDPLDRAKQVFANLKMQETELRNATLVYVAVKDRQAAVFGDAGIHEKVGQQYWEEAVNKMMVAFRQQKLAAGLLLVIHDIGEALHYYFPYDSTTDKNELPDDIVFGR